LVEQLIRNQQVIGSSPIVGSISLPPVSIAPEQIPAWFPHKQTAQNAKGT
jgi:hypothetical protein